ncbi:MAG: ribonuclease III [Gammaproteobacteria bacterium]|nr:ribonuclease III [Gammaproteobacteria bacterium]
MPAGSEPLANLTARLDHQFQDRALLDIALTHRSTGGQNNERLEYLGDAVLAFLVAEILYLKFPGAPEGVLTRLRASLVKRESLAAVARSFDIGNHVRLGSGEKKSGGWRRDSILANTLEALIGAVYLDAGLESCRKLILRLFGEKLSNLSTADPGKDPKTALQELLQARGKPLPVYELVSESGAPHARTFTVRCVIGDLDRTVIANGNSKRNAEQSAANIALELLRSAPR